jgi:hypothetical protein
MDDVRNKNIKNEIEKLKIVLAKNEAKFEGKKILSRKDRFFLFMNNIIQFSLQLIFPIARIIKINIKNTIYVTWFFY